MNKAVTSYILIRKAQMESLFSEVSCSVSIPINGVLGVTDFLAHRSHGVEEKKEIIAGPILTPF